MKHIGNIPIQSIQEPLEDTHHWIQHSKLLGQFHKFDPQLLLMLQILLLLFLLLQVLLHQLLLQHLQLL